VFLRLEAYEADPATLVLIQGFGVSLQGSSLQDISGRDCGAFASFLV
jgi:hypothetical protein